MDKVLRNVVNKVIELKRSYVSEISELKELNNSRKFNEMDRQVSKILNSLKSKVSPDIYKAVGEIVDIKDYQSNLYMDFYFKKGVIEGVTDLNFLSEIKNIAYIDSFGGNEDEGQ